MAKVKRTSPHGQDQATEIARPRSNKQERDVLMVDKKSKNYSPARARMKEVTGDLYQEARDAKAA